MSKWPMARFGDINEYSGSSINPMDEPSKFFELYSVPSYDNDYPEIIYGKNIGSTKMTVEKNDVLLCKINPRINRVWVVSQYTNHPLIASSEWIVFRNKKIYPKYLHWYFKSDAFRTKLISQVAGIGGSLTRAQPKQVDNYLIPLPPLPEQRRIAETLDRAQRLIDLRKKQIAEMDALAQAVFIEMFGDPKTNPRGWDVVRFPQTADIDTRMTTDFDRYSSYPHVGIENIERDTGRILNCRTVGDSELVSGKYVFSSKHVIYSKIRPNLNKVALPTFSGLCSADAYPIMPKENVTREYLTYIMRSDYFLGYILSHSDRTNIPKVNRNQLSGFRYMVPPKELQVAFANNVNEINREKVQMEQGLTALMNVQKVLTQQLYQ